MDRYHYGKSTILPVKTYVFQTKFRANTDNQDEDPTSKISTLGKNLINKPRPISATIGKAPSKITKQKNQFEETLFARNMNLAVFGSNKPVEKENIALSTLGDHYPISHTAFRASSRSSTRPKSSNPNIRRAVDYRKVLREKSSLILKDVTQFNNTHLEDDLLHNVSIDTEAALIEKNSSRRDLGQLAIQKTLIHNALPCKKKLHGARKLKISAQATQSSNFVKNYKTTNSEESAPHKTQRDKSSSRVASRLFKTPRENENGELRKTFTGRIKTKDELYDSKAVIPIMLSFSNLDQPEESQHQQAPMKLKRPVSSNSVLLKLKGFKKINQELKHRNQEISNSESSNNRPHRIKTHEPQDVLRSSTSDLKFKNSTVGRKRENKTNSDETNNSRPNDGAESLKCETAEASSSRGRAQNTLSLLHNKTGPISRPERFFSRQSVDYINTRTQSQKMDNSHKNPWLRLGGSHLAFNTDPKAHSIYTLEQSSSTVLNKAEGMSVQKLVQTDLLKSQNKLPVQNYTTSNVINNLLSDSDPSPSYTKFNTKINLDDPLYDQKRELKKTVSMDINNNKSNDLSPDKEREKDSNQDNIFKNFNRVDSYNPTRRAVLSDVHNYYKLDKKPLMSQERKSFNDTMDSKQILMGLHSSRPQNAQRDSFQRDSFYEHEDDELPLGSRYHA